MELWCVPIFVISNNVVGVLANNTKVSEFMSVNGIFSESLFKMACCYYDSPYKPARKLFDFYSALALVENMNSVSFGSLCNLCIDKEYGVTIITGHSSCRQAIDEYTTQVSDTFIRLPSAADLGMDPGIKSDDEFSANRKKNFACEKILISFLKCEMIYGPNYGALKVDFKLGQDLRLMVTSQS
jgi:hypothetical protein